MYFAIHLPGNITCLYPPFLLPLTMMMMLIRCGAGDWVVSGNNKQRNLVPLLDNLTSPQPLLLPPFVLSEVSAMLHD